MVMGAMMGAFCEGMALADKAGLEQVGWKHATRGT